MRRRMRRLLLSIALLAGWCGVALGQTSPASEIAPGGKLRVGMIAITVLGGVADPIARFIGQKLGAAVEPVMYPNPDAYLQSFGKGEWDIAIGPRVLAPADKADSTADLWVISLVYVAAPGKEFPNIASVDKAGVKIGTIRDLIAYRLKKDHLVERVASVAFTASSGAPWHAQVFRDKSSGEEQLALVHGTIDPDGPVLVRMHSIDLFADLIGESSPRSGAPRSGKRFGWSFRPRWETKARRRGSSGSITRHCTSR